MPRLFSTPFHFKTMSTDAFKTSAAKGLFAYSILYLFLLFGVLVIETAAAIVINRLA